MALVITKEIRAPVKTSVKVFEIGKYSVHKSEIQPSWTDTTSPPKPIFIATPAKAGTYPVMVFFHGCFLGNYYYTDLFIHIASHGYIIVAPQLYDPRTDVDGAALVINWLSGALKSALPHEVEPDLGKFVLAGHSRGGRTAFAVALGKVKTSLAFSAVIGVDPVAGQSKDSTEAKEILTYVPQSLDIKAPILVIGGGLSDKPKLWPLPACAPVGVNHKEFFNECCAPCCYFVATEHGHMDMLDDDPKPFGPITYCMCVNGIERKPMRKFVGGIVVAFLEAHLDKDPADLTAIFQDPTIAPVELDPPQHR